MNRKIFHISTSLKGGAGIAALNLHLTLLRDGFDSTILTLDPVNHNNLTGLVSIKRTFIEKVIGKLFTYLQLRFNNYTFFSTFSSSAQGLLSFLMSTAGDSKVLHIHNWYNFLDLKWLAFLEENGFEVIFTLHDQRLMTGGCHYSGSCKNFESDCKDCPLSLKFLRYPVQRSQENTRKSLAELNRFKIVTPSEWLKSEALKSKILRTANITVIQNIFPRIEYELSPYKSNFENGNEIKIGIASMDPFATIKGGDFLKNLIANPGKCEFIFLRDYRNNIGEFWNQTNILLVPSLQDNSPNVIHEAKLHGIPVIGSRTGGIPELLSKDYDLVVASPMSLTEFNKLFPDYLGKLSKIKNLKQMITYEYAVKSELTHNKFLKFLNLK